MFKNLKCLKPIFNMFKYILKIIFIYCVLFLIILRILYDYFLKQSLKNK